MYALFEPGAGSRAPRPPARAKPLPLTLLCRRLDQLDPELMRLWKRCLTEGYEPELEWLEGAPYREIRRVVHEPGRRLLVLCKTTGLDVRTRLMIKHGFIAYARPCHWLTTVCLDEGHEAAWDAVSLTARRISIRQARLQPPPSPMLPVGRSHAITDREPPRCT